MKELIYNFFFKKTKDTKLQFLRYLFVGGFAAVINIGSLYFFKEYIGIYYLIANIIGFLLCLITNYILSKLLIFTEENNVNKIVEFATYGIIGVFGLGFDTLFMWLGTSVIGLYYMLSKIISTAIVFIWNFSIRKVLYFLMDKRGNK
ncbi:MAG: GtrA family protein [Clostridia bacterium]|nr:GtrA family protein [Clostridia bacterium]MDD4386820.1 GtrA family protein [Clostridia bacterium]